MGYIFHVPRWLLEAVGIDESAVGWQPEAAAVEQCAVPMPA